jgi:hypothetical protein
LISKDKGRFKALERQMHLTEQATYTLDEKSEANSGKRNWEELT